MTATVQLGDVAAIRGLVGGPFGSSLGSKDYVADGVPVVRGGNLGYGMWIGGDFVYVTREKFERDLKRNSAVAGDIIFTQRGTLGQVALVPVGIADEFVVSQSQMRLRVDPTRFDARYVYYACTDPSFVRVLSDRAISTGVPHINLGILAELSIPDWPLTKQRAISEVLGALDDKIAANDRLTTLAHNLLESEFASLARTTSKRARLGEIARLEYGKALPKARRREGVVPVYGSGGIGGYHDEPLRSGPGVIVGRKGTVGSVYWAQRDFYAIDTTYFVSPLHHSPGLPYLYFALRAMGLGERNSDSAVPGLNRDAAYQLEVPLAAPPQRDDFENRVRTAFEYTEAIGRESRALANLRDTLLPALMSGRLSVKDAESTVSEVV